MVLVRKHWFTPNYHTNVVEAFLTAPALAEFLSMLTNGRITVAAHSLGNMVVLSALNDWNAHIVNYFMLDAAVAIEAIDGSSASIIDDNMVHPQWSRYANRLWASRWSRLFSAVMVAMD